MIAGVAALAGAARQPDDVPPAMPAGGDCTALRPPARCASGPRARRRLSLTLASSGVTFTPGESGNTDGGEGATSLGRGSTTLTPDLARPQRRLILTFPTGARATRLPGGARKSGRMAEATFYLPKEVLEALEEEWWRRQMTDEEWSRSEIVTVAVEAILTNRHELDQALQRLSEEEPA